MSVWTIVAVVAIAGGVAAFIAWARPRRAREASQDPQNIYPLW
jgi:hypothetical protein